MGCILFFDNITEKTSTSLTNFPISRVTDIFDVDNKDMKIDPKKHKRKGLISNPTKREDLNGDEFEEKDAFSRELQ